MTKKASFLSLLFLIAFIFSNGTSSGIPDFPSKVIPSSQSDKDEELIKAARSNDQVFLVRLLEAGADINSQDWSRDTPLCFAIDGKHMQVVSILLERGADVNKVCMSGSTALMKASNDIDLAVKLLHYKANPLLKDNRGKSAVDYPWDDQSKKLLAATIHRFMEAHPDVKYELPMKEVPSSQSEKDEELIKASKSGDFEFVSRLLDAGADIDTQDWMKDTPLCLAVDGKHTQTAELLLERGADVNKVCMSGSTAFMRASSNIDLAEKLLHFKANPLLKDNNGKTAVDHIWEHDSKTAFSVMITRIIGSQ